MKFEDLGLSPETLKAIADKGYETPTPIQAKAIPPILMARDVVGLAQTGTGKTASFTLPMIDALSGGRARMRMPRSLVLAPTRELAAQVAENFRDYGKYHKLSMALLVGGESMGEQTKLLDRGVDVLVATPGRLLDLFGRGAILLSDIRILVIDEADRMLDMGFIPDIEKIVSLLSPMRQTLLFSATMPPEIRRLTEKFLSNPKEVSVAAPATTAITVEQFLVHAEKSADKKRILAQLLAQEDVKNAFIFLNRKRDISDVASFLKKAGHDAAPLHGDMVQARRTETLQAFREGKLKLLVCSDVAARGLDIQGVSHVFNYDVPMHADDYVHRIGRTGRAGMSGRAWMIATLLDEKHLSSIEKLIKNPIPVIEVDTSAKGAKKVHAPKTDDSDAQAGRNKSEKGRSPSRRGSDDEIKKSRPATATTTRKDAGSATKPQGQGRTQDEDGPNIKGFGDDVPGFFGRG